MFPPLDRYAREEDAHDAAYDLFGKGRDLMEVGRFEEAINHLECSWRVSAHFKTAELLGRCYARLGVNGRALEWFGKGLEENPRWQGLYRLRAGVHERMGAIEEAIRDYEVVVSLTPHDKGSREALTRLRAMVKRDSDAQGGSE